MRVGLFLEDRPAARSALSAGRKAMIAKQDNGVLLGKRLPMDERITDRTLAEIAAGKQFTPRQLREFVRRHQIPVLTTGKGGVIRFDRLALVALEEALRAPGPSPSADEKIPALSSSRGRSVFPTVRGDAFAQALCRRLCAT
jgi:hypothetical protein